MADYLLSEHSGPLLAAHCGPVQSLAVALAGSGLGVGFCRICGGELAASPSPSRFTNAPCCDACLHVFDWFSRWLVREAGLGPADVQLSTSLIDAHQGDSFGLVELLMELEDEFGVTISEGSEARLETLEDAIRCVRSAKSVAPRADKRRFWAKTP